MAGSLKAVNGFEGFINEMCENDAFYDRMLELIYEVGGQNLYDSQDYELFYYDVYLPTQE